jgi:hypothetical protein
MAVLPAHANQVLFSMGATTPGSIGSGPVTFNGSLAGTTVTLDGYSCPGATGGLCANNPNTNYSADHATMYDNSNGIGMANNQIGSEYEIPNNEFVQVDFSQVVSKLKTLGDTATTITFSVSNIVTAWSLYTSSVAGELEGSGGAQLVNNAGTGTTTYTFNVSQLPSDNLVSIIAGTNCDVVMDSVTVNYNAAAPEPATCLLMGFALVGLGVAGRKARRRG